MLALYYSHDQRLVDQISAKKDKLFVTKHNHLHTKGSDTMRVKIFYTTHYDNRICGFVYAEDKGSHYEINKRQYARCLKNRTIGGDAGINFRTDKEVEVIS